ncbi:hypothetical protein [Nonomuraea sp. KM90]|uniref:hypothetical protein n=1 Tax=Nonomuraea sp. KM90 TaxID=3457428 RepID=UPI003FCCB537
MVESKGSREIFSGWPDMVSSEASRARQMWMLQSWLPVLIQRPFGVVAMARWEPP